MFGLFSLSPNRDPEFVFYDQLKQVMNAYRLVLVVLGCHPQSCSRADLLPWIGGREEL